METKGRASLFSPSLPILVVFTMKPFGFDSLSFFQLESVATQCEHACEGQEILLTPELAGTEDNESGATASASESGASCGRLRYEGLITII